MCVCTCCAACTNFHGQLLECCLHPASQPASETKQRRIIISTIDYGHPFKVIEVVILTHLSREGFWCDDESAHGHGSEDRPNRLIVWIADCLLYKYTETRRMPTAPSVARPIVQDSQNSKTSQTARLLVNSKTSHTMDSEQPTRVTPQGRQRQQQSSG